MAVPWHYLLPILQRRHRATLWETDLMGPTTLMLGRHVNEEENEKMSINIWERFVLHVPCSLTEP